MITSERSADTHRVLATVATRDLAAMSRYALDGLTSIAGIAAVRTRIVTHMFTEGGHWRIDALLTSRRPPKAQANSRCLSESAMDAITARNDSAVSVSCETSR
ncbi:hypothetical protein OHB30_03330 [Streptomyces europaeiscabiei]|nr:hypothetical protein OHB30_03330 [Streptomyces europaeiscabiei]